MIIKNSLKYTHFCIVSVIWKLKTKPFLRSKCQISVQVRNIFNIILDEVMTPDKEYDFSMVAGEFVEVYSKNPGKALF